MNINYQDFTDACEIVDKVIDQVEGVNFDLWKELINSFAKIEYYASKYGEFKD